jgi:penicillin-binding protein 1A
MLESVAKSGTASLLSGVGIPLAAKTGTVGDEAGNRDVWLACYNPDYAAVVWMGFDDASGGRCLPKDSGGGTYPAMVLCTVFSELYRDRTAPEFRIPDNVVSVPLDGAMLKDEHVAVLANSLTPKNRIVYESFVRGTEPTEATPYWQIPEPPDDLAVQIFGDTAEITFTPPSRYCSYRLYREDADGFSVLLKTFERPVSPIRFSDDIGALSGAYAYYVVPFHPELIVDGTPLCGRASDKYRIGIRHSLSFSP